MSALTTIAVPGLPTISNQPAAQSGVKWGLTAFNGWNDSPDLRGDFPDLPNADGAFAPVRMYRSARRLTLIGYISATSPALAEAAADTIRAFAPVGASFDVTVVDVTGTWTIQAFAGPGAIRVEMITSTRGKFMIPMVAPDGRKYGPWESAIADATFATEEGLVWPMFADGYLDWGTFAPSGQVAILNNGKAETAVVFEVRGSIDDGFQIVSDDGTIEYGGGVAAGEKLILSPYAGGRVTKGTADLTYNLVSAAWPIVGPGETKTITLVPLGSYDANARMTVKWRDAKW